MRALMESCLQVPEMMPSGCGVSVTAGLCRAEGRGAGGSLAVGSRLSFYTLLVMSGCEHCL